MSFSVLLLAYTVMLLERGLLGLMCSRCVCYDVVCEVAS